MGDIRQLAPNIHAAVKYVRRTTDGCCATEPMAPPDEGMFALAACNAGSGRETVCYVSNIYKYRLACRMIEEEREGREAAKRALGG